MADWIPDPDGEHGEVFTRRWIVESCRKHSRALADAEHAIRGFDLLEYNAETTRKAVMAKLLEAGETIDVAERLSGAWVTTGDFLLTSHPERSADFVVGNPPYIRLEDIPNEISDAYRRECSTMRGRADIYVGFYETGLELLRPEGQLAFICADRWMRNQYGAHLRKFVSDNFAVDSVIVMHDVDAFEDEVSAYPAITVLRNGSQKRSRVDEAHEAFDERAAKLVLQWVRSTKAVPPESEAFEAGELRRWFGGPALWPSGSPHQLELIADLERRFPPLQDPRTGTRVGIGVASGCDDVYIQAGEADIEPDRLLPLVMASDIRGGTVEWSGRHLVNPWQEGKLVDLDEYPRMAAYLRANGTRIRARHVARKRPNSWHRTIDRVDPNLLARPKLLLPDMKAASHPVLDTGEHYPHHDLYYVVSDAWDLEVLGGLLLSAVANLFVGAYCVKMRGGTYRFQAQYLRKIRVPDPTSISNYVTSELRTAFADRDTERATVAAASAYGIDRSALARSREIDVRVGGHEAQAASVDGRGEGLE